MRYARAFRRVPRVPLGRRRACVQALVDDDKNDDDTQPLSRN